MTENEFAEWLAADGFGAPAPVEYLPDQRPALHAHDFDARVLIIRGELSMVYEDRVVRLGVGDECEVPAGTLHSEQGSASGANGLLGTRSHV